MDEPASLCFASAFFMPSKRELNHEKSRYAWKQMIITKSGTDPPFGEFTRQSRAGETTITRVPNVRGNHRFRKAIEERGTGCE